MTANIRLTAPVLGTRDPQGLARFYQRLLGWPLRDDEPEWATLRPAAVTIAPGAQDDVEVEIRPPRLPGTAAGPTGLTIRISPQRPAAS